MMNTRRNVIAFISKVKFTKRESKLSKQIVKNHHGEDIHIYEPSANPKRSDHSHGVVITLSTPKFSKSLSLGRVAKKIYLGLAIFLGSFFFIGTGIIIYSASSISELTGFLGNMQDAYKNVQNENDELKNILSGSLEEKQKIKDFEQTVNNKNAANGDKCKIDLSKVTIEQKLMTLRNAPSGYPCPFTGITSEFGSRNHPVLHRSIFHEGVDLRAEYGTNIRSTADGIVEFAKFFGGYGNMLVVQHAYGFRTVYGHLSAFTVKQGDYVGKGQIIAKSGQSGLSDGPHLHYEVRYFDKPLNPKPFLEWNAKNYHNIFEQERSIKWASLLEATKW